MFVDNFGSILVENGIGFSLPAPVGVRYNLSCALSGKKDVEISIDSPAYQLSMKAISTTNGSNPQTFLASGKNNFGLLIPKGNKNEVVKITLDNIDTEISQTFHDQVENQYFDNKNYIQVQGSNGIVQLMPGIKAKHVLRKGICKHFSFMKKSSSFASVATNTRISSGVLKVYVKKGCSLFASESNFDFQSKSEISAVVPIQASEESPHAVVEEYSVSVCSKAWAIFDILLTVDNEVPYATLAAGELMKREIKGGSSFAVHYVARHGEQFSINVDGEVSPIKVYQSSYKTMADMTDFSKLVPKIEDNTQVLASKSAGLPASLTISASKKDYLTHYVFRIVPLATDVVTFYIGSSDPAVQIGLRQNEELQENLSKGESRRYLMQTADLESELSLKIRVESGKIVLKKSEQKGSASEGIIIGENGPETRLIKLKPSKTGNSTDFLMNKAVVNIEATSDCLYDIIFLEPSELFSRIIPGTRYSVKSKLKSKSVKYFYQVRDTTDLKNLKVFFLLENKDKNSEADIKFKDWLLSKAKFYYVTDSSFGMDESDSISKIVADLKNVTESVVGSRQRLTLEFAPQEGYFLIFLEDTGEANHYDLSFELSMNDYFTLGTDGYLVDYAPYSGYVGFQIYVPRKGRLYVDVEDCSGKLLAYGSLDYYQSRPNDTMKKKLTSTPVDFDGPGFYYVSVSQIQGLLGAKEESIPFSLRTEFTDAVRSTWLSSYFSSLGSKGVLNSAKVKINLQKENLTVLVSPSLVPLTSFEKDFPDFDEVDVSTIIIVRSIEEKEQTKKLPCGDLDFQLIQLANLDEKDDNLISVGMNSSTIKRDNGSHFNWTSLDHGQSATASYPHILKNSSNRLVAVSVLVIYQLSGNLIYDTYDDSSIVFGNTSFLRAPDNIEFPTGVEDGAPVTKEDPVTLPDDDHKERSSGKHILILIGMVLLGVCLAVFLKMRCLKNRVGGPDEDGFTRGTRVSTSEEGNSGDQSGDATKQIEITTNQKTAGEDGDETI